MKSFKPIVKKVILFSLLAGLFVCIAGIAAQAKSIYLYWLSNGMKSLPDKPIDFSPSGIIRNAFSLSGLVISVILFGLSTLIYEKFTGTGIYDSRRFSMSRMGTYGTAGWMLEAEAQKVLDINHISRTDGIILGALNGSIASLPHNTMFNKHIAVFGASGSMKSRAYVRNNIMQLAKAGKSMVLTDPKGELFADTAVFLMDNGYTVRLLNLVNPELSDMWNCLGEIGGDELMAQTFADVVIANTRSSGKIGGDPFWDRAEMNLLKALTLYVDRDYPEENRNMAGVYNLLASGDTAIVDNIFANLPVRHPAKAPYNIYCQASENVRTGVVIGLGTRLQVFQNSLIRRMTAGHGIDLTLPAYEKCAYFCIMSDQDSTLDFLSSLFFSFLFIKMVRYADCHNGRCNPEVFMMMDEFPNIGQIPDFMKKISTIRSRGIHCSIIFQNIPQLSNRYPQNAWQEILGNCDTQLFLGCTDILTAEHISSIAGQLTVELESTQTRDGPPGWYDYGKSTKSVGKRYLLNPDEVLRLSHDAALVILRGQKPLMVQKFDYIRHPLSKNLVHIPVRDYIPAWRKQQEASSSSAEKSDKYIITDPDIRNNAILPKDSANVKDKLELRETKAGKKGGFF